MAQARLHLLTPARKMLRTEMQPRAQEPKQRAVAEPASWRELPPGQECWCCWPREAQQEVAPGRSEARC